MKLYFSNAGSVRVDVISEHQCDMKRRNIQEHMGDLWKTYVTVVAEHSPTFWDKGMVHVEIRGGDND